MSDLFELYKEVKKKTKIGFEELTKIIVNVIDEFTSVKKRKLEFSI